MAKFYIPELVQIGKTPVIVYPCEGIEQFLGRQSPDAIVRHLQIVYESNSLSKFQETKGNGEFNIDILWEDRGDLMTDVWKYTQLDEKEEGASMGAQTYRNFRRDTRSDTTAEFGAIVLGEEAKHRLWRCRKDLYLTHRPILDPRITNNQRFFIG